MFWYRSERRGERARQWHDQAHVCGRWGRPCSRCQPCGPRHIRCVTGTIVHVSAHQIHPLAQRGVVRSLSSCAHTATATPPHGALTRPPAPLPAPFTQAELVALYNASHWPKHLLVQYTWRPVVQVDTAGGLLLVLLAGACVCMSLES